jgi:hypothetical protein
MSISNCFTRSGRLQNAYSPIFFQSVMKLIKKECNAGKTFKVYDLVISFFRRVNANEAISL